MNNKQYFEQEHVHQDLVEETIQSLPDEETLYEIAELFKVFGDSTRTKILLTLMKNELCVCEIAQVLKMTKSAISHQLRVLRQAKLVKGKKMGREVIYSLADDHIILIINLALEHIAE